MRRPPSDPGYRTALDLKKRREDISFVQQKTFYLKITATHNMASVALRLCAAARLASVGTARAVSWRLTHIMCLHDGFLLAVPLSHGFLGLSIAERAFFLYQMEWAASSGAFS